MSDVNKIVAAIISTGRFSNATVVVPLEARIKEYQDCLRALDDQSDHKEPVGPDLNTVKAAIIETLDRVLAKK